MRSLANQKRTPPKTSKALAILIILGVAGAGAVGTFVWFKLNDKQVNNTNSSPSDTAGNNGPSKQDANSQVPNVEPKDVPVQENIGISITKLEQQGGMVAIAGAVTGASEGKCVAEFKSAGQIQPVYGEAALSGGSCAINLDEIQFSYIGDWTVTLTYYNTGNTSKAVSQTKTINIH